MRLLQPAHVKPYVHYGKTDSEAVRDPVGSRKLTNDAGAINEAATRPTVGYAPMKSREPQGMRILHSGQDLLATSWARGATSGPRAPNHSATVDLPR